MLRKILLALAAFVVALGAGLAAATPAQAGPAGVPSAAAQLSAADCPAYYLCFFADQDYSGPWVYYAATINNNTTCYNINPSFNNQTSSVINNFTRNVRWYDGNNCTGVYLTTNKNGGTANCQTWLQCSVSGSSMNDRLSSWRFE